MSYHQGGTGAARSQYREREASSRPAYGGSATESYRTQSGRVVWLEEIKPRGAYREASTRSQTQRLPAIAEQVSSRTQRGESAAPRQSNAGGGLAYGVDPIYDQWRSQRSEAGNSQKTTCPTYEERRPAYEERRPAYQERQPNYASMSMRVNHQMASVRRQPQRDERPHVESGRREYSGGR